MNPPVNATEPTSLTPLDAVVLSSDAYQAQQAQVIETQMWGGADNTEATGRLLSEFVHSSEQHADMPVEEWLAQEFGKHPALWQSDAERLATAKEVVTSVIRFNDSASSLQGHLQRGQSEASWIARELEKGAGVSGSLGVGQYATRIDVALAEATAGARVMITNNNGDISFSPNLDGFIAEQHHVDTFNIDAVTKGSEYRAKVVNSNGLNSVDIVIVDGQGNVVHEYQSKYGSDAKATEQLFKRGEYGEQQRLVPEGQGKDIANSTEVVEIDGVHSEPLSKEQALEWQRKAREEAEARQYEWSDTNRINVGKQIGKQALVGASIAAGFHGVRILARRTWNALMGKENPPASVDLSDFVNSSLSSTAQVFTQVAVSGALVVAAKNGLLGAIMKRTPAGQIANIACIALANTKILYQLATGKLSKEEALNCMGQTTTSAVFAIAAGSKGSALGMAIGTVFGPPGIAAGGFIGGMIGAMAGGVVGEQLFEASKSLVQASVTVVNRVTASVVEGAKALVSGLGNFAKGLLA